MILFFWDQFGSLRELARFDSSIPAEELSCRVNMKIREFCDKHNFHIYYTRIWNDVVEGRQMTVFDVGSHDEFFCTDPPLEIRRPVEDDL